ncbi:MAG: hypothetical protein EBZ28_05745 [Alphaproteobacteria bacterium]|nr:hypothetical protein [Alphaproteobacteria bacterium]
MEALLKYFSTPINIYFLILISFLTASIILISREIGPLKNYIIKLIKKGKEKIKLTGNSNVNVVINEPESMKNLSGQLKADIMKQVSLEIDKKLGNYDRETSGEGAADKSKIMGKN